MSADTNARDNLLAEGNGKESPVLTLIIMIPINILGFVISIVIISLQAWNSMIGFPLMFIHLLLIVITINSIACIKKTCIRVYEDELEGCGILDGILASDIFSRWVNFRLTYDLITSVESGKNYVIINASAARYRCYVSDPTGVRDTIFQQQKRLKQASISSENHSDGEREIPSEGI